MKKKIIFSIAIILVVFLIAGIIRYDVFGQQVPIIAYHHFLNNSEIKKYKNVPGYVVTSENFDKQMKYLADNGYKSITLDELLCWKKGKCKIPKKSVVIVIDDGLTSTYHYAKPTLEKYNFTATLFTISSRMEEQTHAWRASTLDYIGKDMLQSDDKTINIQSHSHDLHYKEDNKKAIEIKNYDEINADLKTSKEILNAKYLAYPFNSYNYNMLKALKNNGYLLAFKGGSKKTYKNEYKYITSRIFVNNDMEFFKSIFETKEFNQSLKDKIIEDLMVLKKKIMHK